MLRLTLVFLIWMASTACPPEIDKYERSYYYAADVDRGAAHSSRNQR